MEEKKESQGGSQSGIYEIGYLTVPTVSEEKIGEEVSKVKNLIEENGGKFINEGDPYYMNLAYPMKVQTEKGGKMFDSAYFGWVKFELPSESLPSVKKSMSGNAKVLRHILVATVREDTFITKEERMAALNESNLEEEGNDEEANSGGESSAIKKEEKRDLTKEEEKELDNAIEELVDEA